MTTNLPAPNLADPAHYRICALGLFSPGWLEMLSGEWVIANDLTTQSEATTLVGHVLDQAALLGVLEQLYSLGLPLLSLERLTPRLDPLATASLQSHHNAPSEQKGEDYKESNK